MTIEYLTEENKNNLPKSAVVICEYCLTIEYYPRYKVIKKGYGCSCNVQFSLKKYDSKEKALRGYNTLLLLLERKPNKTSDNFKRIEGIKRLIENLKKYEGHY